MGKADPIFRSLSIIEERLLEKLTVENLADSIHFSKYHYQRLFRETVGDSVMRHITRRRISLAAEELVSTDATVLEIALKYGYETHEGFTRSFRSVMGVSPTQYRKYRLSPSHPKNWKEKSAMTYSKITGDILENLNSLIVQAKETAAYTRKNKGLAPEAAAFYSSFWEFIASRTDSMADSLKEALRRIAGLAQRPDEISARFLIVKAVEDAAFQSYLTAFQAGLTMARAMPAHREAYRPLCGQYEALAKAAEIKAGRIAEFFRELTALIFAEMREKAEQRIQRAIEKGRAASALLTEDPRLPYAYLAEEIASLTDGLASTPLGEITVSKLEDCRFRLEAVAFAADMDLLRAPFHKEILDSVLAFRESVGETAAYFEALSADLSQALAESESPPSPQSIQSNWYRDTAAQESLLLFCLKGELQKLGDSRLSQEQKAAFEVICRSLTQTVELAERASEESAFRQIDELREEACAQLTAQAKALGVYGTAIEYIAEELRRQWSR